MGRHAGCCSGRTSGSGLRHGQVRRHAGPHAILGTFATPRLMASRGSPTPRARRRSGSPLGERPEPGDDLRELALPVPGHPAIPEDLPAAISRETSLRASIPKVSPDVQPRGRAREVGRVPAWLRLRLPGMHIERHLVPDHQPGELPRVRPGMSSVVIERPLRRIVVRSAIAKTRASWGDEDDGAARRPSPGRSRTAGRSRPGQDGRRLVEDQDARAAVEALEDVDPLALAERQLPDPGRGSTPSGTARRSLDPPRPCGRRRSSA